MPGMMEKGAELLGGKNRAAPNGTKSSSPSNGHYSEPESGGGDSGDEHDVGMRVGAEYQARIPDFEPGFHWCQMISYRKRIGPELLT